MECSICYEQMIYVPPSQWEKWSTDEGPVECDNGEPYTKGDIPVLAHGHHMFHRKCIRTWLKQPLAEAKPAYTSLYRKIFSKILPFIVHEQHHKGKCPVCREVICTKKLIDNVKMTPEFVHANEGKIQSAEQLPIPDRYDPHTVYREPKRQVLEMSFVVTVLMITTLFITIKGWITSFNKSEGQQEDRNEYARTKAAHYYGLTQEDFYGYKSIYEYFLKPKGAQNPEDGFQVQINEAEDE